MIMLNYLLDISFSGHTRHERLRMTRTKQRTRNEHEHELNVASSSHSLFLFLNLLHAFFVFCSINYLAKFATTIIIHYIDFFIDIPYTYILCLIYIICIYVWYYNGLFLLSTSSIIFRQVPKNKQCAKMFQKTQLNLSSPSQSPNIVPILSTLFPFVIRKR